MIEFIQTLFFWIFVAAVLMFGGLAAIVGATTALGVVLSQAFVAFRTAFGPDAAVDHLRIDPPARGEPGEPAYRSYLFGPVLRDFRIGARKATRAGWRWLYQGDERPLDTIGLDPDMVEAIRRKSLVERISNVTMGRRGPFADHEWFGAFQTFGAVVVGVTAGGLAGAVLGAVATVVFLVLLGIYLAGVGIAALVMRIIEIGMLWVRGITVECVNCGRRVQVPAYDCDGCLEHPPARHHKLLPGMHGVLSRTCRCEKQLPTLILRGRSTLKAYCSHEDCQEPLPDAGLTAPTFHVPVVAGRSAGKSVLMLSMLTSLHHAKGFEFADETAQRDYMTAKAGLSTADFSGVPATAPELPLRATTFYVDQPGPRRLVYLYDAAGEKYESEDVLEGFRFLGSIRGAVLVVDPTALDSVSAELAEDTIKAVRPSAVAPKDVAQRFAAGLRASRRIAADVPLSMPVAVVVTKADVLAASSAAHPYAAGATERRDRSAAVRRWLCEQSDGTALVTGIEASFRTVGYFAVSGLDAAGRGDAAMIGAWARTVNDDVADPLQWLLLGRKARSR